MRELHVLEMYSHTWVSSLPPPLSLSLPLSPLPPLISPSLDLTFPLSFPLSLSLSPSLSLSAISVSLEDASSDGGPLCVTLLPNPSHLEAVNPVTVGKARGRLLSLAQGQGQGQSYCSGREGERGDRNRVRGTHTHSLTHSLTHLLTHSLTHLLAHSLTCSPTHSPTHPSLMHSHTHPHPRTPSVSHTHTHTHTHRYWRSKYMAMRHSVHRGLSRRH